MRKCVPRPRTMSVLTVHAQETTIFIQVAGFPLDLASLMSSFLATWLVLVWPIPVLLIDILSRRKNLLSTAIAMSLCFAAITATLSQSERGITRHIDGIVITIFLFLYMGFFVIGFQAIVFVYPMEALPLRFRAKGNALSASCQWIFSYAVVEYTPLV